MSGSQAPATQAPGQTASGMRRIPFAVQSYQHPSRALSSQRLLNWRVEQEPANARVVAAVVPSAGLKWWRSLGHGPIWCMDGAEPGRVYVVSGSRFFRIVGDLDGVSTADLGDIGTPDASAIPDAALMVTVATGPTACVVCVPPKAFTCDHFGALHEITDPDFPGAASVTYLDGYFVFTSYESSTQFFVSRLLDPSNFDALDFAFSDGLPNVIRRGISHRGDIWLLGGAAIEIWYNSGDADFPFRRQSGGVIPVGVVTPKSVARGDNSVFWVGTDCIVYRSLGYKAERISDHALELYLQSSFPSLIKQAMVHAEGGHTLYTFSLGAKTFSYDCATQLWHERSSWRDGSGPWLVSSLALFGDLLLLGDAASNNIYTLDPTGGQDNGTTVMRQAVLPPLWAGTSRAYCGRLEIEMEVGDADNPDMLLQWSDDGGVTWTAGRLLETGVGQPRKRVFTTRLGSFRQRMFRLTCSGRTTLYALDADITAGAH